MDTGELSRSPETPSGRRSFLQVWSDAGGWRATVQYGNEPPRTFHEPDDALLFLYSCLLGRQEAAPATEDPSAPGPGV